MSSAAAHKKKKLLFLLPLAGLLILAVALLVFFLLPVGLEEPSDSDSASAPTETGSATDSSVETGRPPEPVDPLEGILVLSEVSPANRTLIPDGDGEYCDWIELYNASDEAISLKGVSLSDGGHTWPFPEMTLNGGEYLVVYASGKDRGDREALHTSFRLGQDGDRVLLYQQGKQIDAVEWSCAVCDDTSLALADGTWVSRRQATPGYPNTPEGAEAFLAGRETEALAIWEVMTSNDTLLPQSGKYYDWFELKNTSHEAVSLSGWSVGTKADRSDAAPLPNVTLRAGQLLTVFAAGKGKTAGRYSVPFGLNAESETMYLFAPDGHVADALCAAETSYRGSYGRMDGDKGFFYFADPTPGEENREGKRDVTAPPTVSVPDGLYPDTQTLEVALSGEGEIYYTLDGSEPTDRSQRYAGPLHLKGSTVLRAVCISSDKVTGSILTACYFLGESVTLPVVNIAILPDDMWSDESGIYALGPNAQEEEPYYGANFWKEWEKKINLSYYDGDGKQFSVDCGLKMFGGWGRAERKKSFQVKFRGVYGCSELNYPVFGEDFPIKTFQSLVLRSGSQDFEASTIRDIFMASLADREGLNVAVQNYRFCLLYINGEYWGVYSFREKVDDDYVASHTGASADSVNIVGYGGGPECGSPATYNQLLSFARSHDLSTAENYAYMEAHMDLDSYIDWYIAVVWSGSTDLDNVRCFSTGDDPRWRWVLYDFDMAFTTHTSFSYIARQYPHNHILMAALMKTPRFREKFFTRLGELLSGPLSAETALARIDAICAEVDGEMARDRSFWKLSYSGWQNWVARLRAYVDGSATGKTRAEELRDSAVTVFSMTADEVARYFG